MENRLNKSYKNSKGVTLLELLAVIVILGIVFSLGTNLFNNVQKQYAIQNEQIEQQKNLRLASQYISKDIRKGNVVSIPEKNVLIIGESSNQIKYELINDKLMRNGIELVTDISKFSITGLDTDTNELTTGDSSILIGVKIELETTQNQLGKTEKLSSTIYLRK